MKKFIPILTVAAALLSACESKTTKTDAKLTSEINPKDSVQCYQYIKDRDTAALTLNIDDDKVTGSLSYNLFEKDKNNGVIAGIIKGDTIIADYSFQSEGTTSIRQVAWVKKDNQLLEGYGEVVEVDGKTEFKDQSKLSFEKAIIFTKINCK